METFVQHALVGLVSAFNRYGSNVVADYDPKGLGFVPIRERMPPPEVGAAITAYLEAVRDSRPFEDVLGMVHAELLAVKGGEGLGQFFTPYDLNDLIEGIAVMHFQHRPGRGASIHEPACGAGGLLLAAVRARLDEYPSDDISVDAIDLDPFCCAMTALQLQAAQAIHQMPLKVCQVAQGNALLSRSSLRILYQSKPSSGFIYDKAWAAFRSRS